MNKKTKLGIMQGRFTDKEGFFPQRFPWENWEKEFEIAKKENLQCIEWMLNYEKVASNPILSIEGQHKIMELERQTGVQVNAVCVNYIMDKCILDIEKDFFVHIFEAMKKLRINLFIMPFFEKSDIELMNEEPGFQECLTYVSDLAKKNGLYVGMEMNCELGIAKSCLQKYKNFGICYDLGNSVGLGKDIEQELLLFKNRIFDVHIKDKTYNGKSVMLGNGDAEFQRYFKLLEETGFNGAYILESYFSKNTVMDTLQNIKYIRTQGLR